VELLLQVGTFCVAVGALIAGIRMTFVNFLIHWKLNFQSLVAFFLFEMGHPQTLHQNDAYGNLKKKDAYGFH
jgi:hypothetical protein